MGTTVETTTFSGVRFSLRRIGSQEILMKIYGSQPLAGR